MDKIRVFKNSDIIEGDITLGGSKSISNRVLIIQALCEQDFSIKNLSDSDDTQTLQRLLDSEANELDAHHAGTTFRFLTSYVALRKGEKILTGSKRMQERPIKALVDALIQLGANISYLKSEGYPPLKIGEPTQELADEITISAHISSQYISSLLLVAPVLPKGLKINLEGDIVSKPYLEMTLRIMQYFGIQFDWTGATISIPPQKYVARDFYVEADWSAASYYYSMAALAKRANILLRGLKKDSLQGDSAIREIAEAFGVQTEYTEDGVQLIKNTSAEVGHYEYNFIDCPDIAQSVSVLAAGRGTTGLFSGLQTLRIKETDRIRALQVELEKVGVFLNELPKKFSKKSEEDFFLQEGEAMPQEKDQIPTFETYNDHRMAMSFAPLAMLFPIEILDHQVVSKSYPNFWDDLKKIGFTVKNQQVR